MEPVWAVIEERAAKLAKHPLLQRLEQGRTLDDLTAFGPGLTFWVVTFQDILRLCDQVVTDPLAKEVARCIRLEDRGHDDWFFHDLVQLDCQPSLRWVLGSDHAVARDAAHQLVSEVHRAQSDMARVTLLVVLESSGTEFFTRVASYIDRSEQSADLKYFHKAHLEAEKDHSLWQEHLERLARLDVPQDVIDECLALVDRAFDAFDRLFTYCENLAQSTAFASAMPSGRAHARRETLD